MTNIFEAKQTLDSNIYEKHIASLEEDKQALQEQCAKLEAKFKAQQAAHNKKRLAHYQGLMNFLTDLHKQLGNVQGQILAHIGKLNGLVMEENERNVSEAGEKLREVLALTATLVGEEKTSSGLLPMLED